MSDATPTSNDQRLEDYELNALLGWTKLTYFSKMERALTELIEQRKAVETKSPLDEEFFDALDRAGVREPLEVYDSNSYRRVGIKGQYRELVYAVQQRSDGHLDIHGTPLLRAMVAAFNAMLARSGQKASAPSPVLDPTTWEVDPCSRGALYRHLPCGESYAMPPWGQQAAREDHAKDCKAENGEP